MRVNAHRLLGTAGVVLARVATASTRLSSCHDIAFIPSSLSVTCRLKTKQAHCRPQASGLLRLRGDNEKVFNFAARQLSRAAEGDPSMVRVRKVQNWRGSPVAKMFFGVTACAAAASGGNEAACAGEIEVTICSFVPACVFATFRLSITMGTGEIQAEKP